MGFLTGRGYMPSATAVQIQPQLTAGQRRSHQGNTSANRAGRSVLELELEAGHGQGERTQGTQSMPWHVGGCWETPWKLPSPRHTPCRTIRMAGAVPPWSGLFSWALRGAWGGGAVCGTAMG